MATPSLNKVRQALNGMSFWAGLLLAGCTLLSVASCSSPPRHEVAADPKILRVGVSVKSTPMIFKQGWEYVGVEADLAHGLGKALGKEVVFVEEDWQTMIDALCDNRIDIIMSAMSITPARSYRIAFTNPYLKVGQLALTRTGEKYSYLMNLAGQAKNGVGVKPGTTADFLVQQEFRGVKLKYYKTGENAADALVDKDIDLFISDGPMIWYLAGLYENKGLAVMPMVLTQEQLAWGVRRADTQLLDAANAYLQKAQASGELNAIFSKWMPGFR